ncbi:MAG TPA: DUF2846 domain-containing protein [Candidatus Binataceae bacterium]|nr:DUF2846 domain-containing protein [Candidatus Binataceae bacterium]
MSGFTRLSNIVAVCVLGLALAACASGPLYSEMQGKIPNLAAYAGRIYIYRTGIIGAGVQPAVEINGLAVGSTKPEGFFYVDRPPGNYTITASIDVDRPLSLTLDAGQTRYVRLDVGFGWVVPSVHLELVPDAEGEKDISALHYTGQIGSAALQQP